MTDRKALFKKADLERALKAIRDTGMTMAVEVTRDGTIRLIPSETMRAQVETGRKTRAPIPL
jgi:hypothetical protein